MPAAKRTAAKPAAPATPHTAPSAAARGAASQKPADRRGGARDPKRLRLGAEPRTFLHTPEQWPDGRPRAGAPTPLLVGLVIARKVAAWKAAEGLTVTAFAERTGMSRQAAHDLLSGRQLADFYTIVRLEEATGQQLWPTTEELSAAR